jgi:hypothetical protein
MRMEFATPSAIPRLRSLGLVTKISSPTIWSLFPSREVRRAQPSQSSSARPSSMETRGNSSAQRSYISISSWLFSLFPSKL